MVKFIGFYSFGGTDGQYHYNDTWAFDLLTRKWTELKCIGFIPSPREGHAAAVVDDVIYVFGGRGVDGKDLGDLAAFKISSASFSNDFHKGALDLIFSRKINGGICSKTWARLLVDVPGMRWLRWDPRFMSLVESHSHLLELKILASFTFLTRVSH